MIDDETNNAQKESENRIDLIDVLSVLWQRRKFIAIVTSVATILGIVISLLLPLKFTSTATILPDADKSKIPGGISDLASLADVSVGGGDNLTTPYPRIIKSKAVLNVSPISKRCLEARWNGGQCIIVNDEFRSLGFSTMA